jgi:predicted PurR-regulated permease PerM
MVNYSISSARPPAPWYVRLAVLILVVGVLKIGRDVFVPVAFAVLIVFLLRPLVMRLTRWQFPKPVAIGAAVGLAFIVTGALGWLVTDQALRLGQELPNYEQNLYRKIDLLKQPHTPHALEHLATMMDKMRRQVAAPTETKPTSAGVPAPAPAPVPVEVYPADPSPFAMVRQIITPVLHPLGTAGIVIVFVIAMLFQREDLRDRFMRLVGPDQLNSATQALDDASNRISRYLCMQFLVNAAYGIPIGIGLHAIGVPNALLWGVMATVLRFVPYIGSWIAAAFPVVLSLVIDPGWTKLFYTVGLFALVEVISINVVEVILYSGSTGVSNMALLVAAVFWTWLWGASGLILSTPLTVCLLVAGRHVPSLKGLSMLLGNEPALPPPAQFYQAMLSKESEYMFDLAASYLAKNSLDDFYEQVFVPALILSEEDRHHGTLAEGRQAFIFQASRDLIEELETRDKEGGASDKKSAAQKRTLAAAPRNFVGVPARDVADELAARMLAHLLRRRGHRVEIATHASSLADVVVPSARKEAAIAFISALPPSALSSARLSCRRLKDLWAKLPVVVGVWSASAEVPDLLERLAQAKPDAVVTSFQQAITTLENLAGEISHDPPISSPTASEVAQLPAAKEALRARHDV